MSINELNLQDPTRGASITGLYLIKELGESHYKISGSTTSAFCRESQSMIMYDKRQCSYFIYDSYGNEISLDDLKAIADRNIEDEDLLENAKVRLLCR